MVAATIRPATVVGVRTVETHRRVCVERRKGNTIARPRGVPISGVGSSAAFNCISISSQKSPHRGDFSIGVAVSEAAC